MKNLRPRYPWNTLYPGTHPDKNLKSQANRIRSFTTNEMRRVLPYKQERHHVHVRKTTFALINMHHNLQVK
jgi:hypothetical protein